MRQVDILDIFRCAKASHETKNSIIHMIMLTKECEGECLLYVNEKGDLYYDMGSEKWPMNICIPELGQGTQK